MTFEKVIKKAMALNMGGSFTTDDITEPAVLGQAELTNLDHALYQIALNKGEGGKFYIVPVTNEPHKLHIGYIPE